jgi:hypothetical protein
MIDQLFTFANAPTRLWDPSTIGFLFILFLLFSCLLRREYRSWKRLAHIPGPSTAHFSIWWLLRHAWGGNLFPCMVNAANQYGRSLEHSFQKDFANEYTQGILFALARIFFCAQIQMS